MSGWRLARALEALRGQVNERYPQRSKVSDGTIGDTAHSARKSDHNPNEAGVVCAWDVTHDLDKKGDDFDGWKFAETLRLNRDPRIGYVISNGRICSGDAGPQPWTWRAYTGSNKHAHHTHISVRQDAALYDDPAPWKIDLGGAAVPPPVVLPPVGITDAMRQRMAATIIGYEAKRDKAGHLAVHRPSDGSAEVAGINDRHHPKEAGTLLAMIAAGNYLEAERAAQSFILSNTKVATGWTTDAGAEFYLRDCVFNRGPKGGARILQRAVGVPDDGEVGQITRAAIGRVAPTDLLTGLRAARESYERDVVGYRAALWVGLVSRWDKALTAARVFQQEAKSAPVNVPAPIGKSAQPPLTKKQTGVMAALAAIFASIAAFVESHPFIMGGGIVLIVLAFIAWRVLRRKEP